MTTLVQLSIKFSACNILHQVKCRKPINYNYTPLLKVASSSSSSQRRRHFRGYSEKRSIVDMGWDKGGILRKDGALRWKRRVVLVRFNQGLGPPGGGGEDDGATGRLLGNIALVVGLTYLSVTGQLGWILDAIVSIWLVAFLIPIVGLGAFIWWAGRDIVVGSCPNCGNDFQVFKSSLNKDVQLCPYCTQPFSVVDDKFVKDSVKFSNQSSTFGQAFNDFSRSKKGKDSSSVVVDVEAEIKDAD